MKFYIYVRASNEGMVNMLIEQGKVFCLQSGLDLQNVYFDIGIVPSSPKSRWKGFFKLIEEIQEGDCILCQRIGDLPSFFHEIKPSLSVWCWSSQPIKQDRDLVNFYLKTR
jgi:DNA invertase Pin-like site-specific DNA recombinase